MVVVVWYNSVANASDPFLQAHEKCHQDQMKEMGGADKFWHEYTTDQQFACEAELSCGAPKNHFACAGIGN